MSAPPAARLLSLGAGVQSTTVLLMAAHARQDPAAFRRELGRISPAAEPGAAEWLASLDGAIFSDTGWEPKQVYDHLDRLVAEVADPAGIPVHRVSAGNIRDDALDPAHRFASMPLYVRNPDGTDGMTRRQCTSEYKVKPIKAKLRELLGSAWIDYPCSTCRGVGALPDRPDRPCRTCDGDGNRPRWGPVPAGVYAEQWIGISLDEYHRARDSDVRYARNRFPLLDLRLSRDDCTRYLTRHGWATTPKSACVGCPFHGNRAWRDLRDNHPAEWADAVDFDAAIRQGNLNPGLSPLRGEAYLHRSRLPLDQAPIGRVTRAEWADRQTDIFGAIADDDDKLAGCSPFACRADTEVTPL